MLPCLGSCPHDQKPDWFLKTQPRAKTYLKL